ncbi:hypothetical protein [Rhizobium sp. NFR12]|uniref:beta family protein n=1 Tax=Rhizobium sp. NFR12 TaxID=1566261 RepID=UPI0008A729C3|nr:hypothetical protein [Rhizobium sp. NFR12]SEH24140.1 Beta protein [Rhizobium sp. NFR12]
MFDRDLYFPAMSTRVHEQLAYSKCSADVKDRMVPIVTLTRYGKSETLLETAEVLLADLDGRNAIVDFDPEPRPTTSAEEATERRKRKEEARIAKGGSPGRPRTEKQLALDAENRRRTDVFNKHVEGLIDPNGGGVHWVEMISELPDLVPILQTVHGQVEQQLDILRRRGTRGALRIKARDPGQTKVFFDNIARIRDHADAVLIIVDFEDIRGRVSTSLETAKLFYAQMYEGFGEEADVIQTVLLSNSFPGPPLRDVSRKLPIEDLSFHREVANTFPTRYGDYMSIPPRRGSGISANGWFPHVDLVSREHWHICLFENNSDETKYVDAAKELHGGLLWRQRADCWGARVIEQVATDGTLVVDGKRFTTPTSWLSVRANQHLNQFAASKR